MPQRLNGPTVCWATANNLAQQLGLNYAATGQATVWHTTPADGPEADELTLLFDLATTGGVPASVEVVVLVRYPTETTVRLLLNLTAVAAGVATWDNGVINIPVAAVGSGITALAWALPAFPIPAGCEFSIQAKRTGGHANNTLLVRYVTQSGG